MRQVCTAEIQVLFSKLLQQECARALFETGELSRAPGGNVVPRVVVRIKLSKEQVMDHYRGVIREVVTLDGKGRSVQFPAMILRQFVTEEGVRGVFEITFDDRNKLIAMRRVDPSADLDRVV